MSWSDFAPGAAPSVRPSPSESQRLGIDVFRATVPFAPPGEEPARWNLSLVDCPADLIVVRCPAGVSDWTATLPALGLTALPVGTLRYFRRSIDNGDRPAPGAQVAVPSRVGEDEVRSFAKSAFAGYRNHYTANPALRPTEPADGYSEWIVKLATDEPPVVVRDSVGIAALMAFEVGQGYGELLLGAVRGDCRRRGLFRTVTEGAVHVMADKGATEVFSAAEGQNAASVAAHFRLGFELVGELATWHLMRTGVLGA